MNQTIEQRDKRRAAAISVGRIGSDIDGLIEEVNGLGDGALGFHDLSILSRVVAKLAEARAMADRAHDELSAERRAFYE